LDLADVTEISLFFLVLVFVVLCAVSLVLFLVRRRRIGSWRRQYPHPVRSLLVRLGIAAAAATSVFVLITAALTLNSHRPTGDNSPVLRIVAGERAPVKVDLELDDCDDPVRVGVAAGAGAGGRFAGFYTDADGFRRIRLDHRGRASFDVDGLVSDRGLLSCYLQVPAVRGNGGPSSVRLAVGPEMEVDTFSSIPAPARYSGGRWSWGCPPGEACPVLATVNYAIEEGAKQVIVLVLAALFGSIIALFIGEALIEPLRRRLEAQRPR
jgi:amino acid transporter